MKLAAPTVVAVALGCAVFLVSRGHPWLGLLFLLVAMLMSIDTGGRR